MTAAVMTTVCAVHTPCSFDSTPVTLNGTNPVPNKKTQTTV